MLTDQRKTLILDELARDGRVVARSLARRFDLSEDTIRRDLRDLAAQGHCRRVYGGAVAPNAGPLAYRHALHSEEKARLGAAAAALLSPGDRVIIDAGSTNTAIARAIPEGLALTVVTNAIDIATILSGRSGIDLIVLGGAYSAETGACTGPAALNAVAGLSADILFLGSCGIDGGTGATAHRADEAAIKTAMADSARNIVVAATRDKLATSAAYRVVAPERIDRVLLTGGAESIAPLRAELV